QGGDNGQGQIQVFLGDKENWTEENLNPINAPDAQGLALGGINGSFAFSQSYSFALDASRLNGIRGALILIVVMQNSGNQDVAFASKENAVNKAPQLKLTLNGSPPVNQNPVASFTASPMSGRAPLTVNFDASGSSDPDGNIVDYSWDFEDGNTASGINASNTFAAGTYNVTLTLTDDQGAISKANQLITVSPDTGSTTAKLCPVQDAYLENGKLFNNQVIRLETGNRNRVGYLQYDLRQINGTITSAQLQLTVPNSANGGDAGSGQIQVFLGDNNAWNEMNLANNTPGKSGVALGSLNTTYGLNQSFTFNLDATRLNSGGALSLILESNAAGGNDVAFASEENAQALCPTLILEIDGQVNPPSGPRITAFRLINAGNDQDLAALSNDQIVDIQNTGTRFLSIQALTDPAEVGSVIFQLSGPVNKTQTENIVPYALFGDNSGDFNGVNLPDGTYTLLATPYSGKKGAGTAGRPLSITFQVIDLSTLKSTLGQSSQLYPNPSEGEVTLDLQLPAQEKAEVFIYDNQGQMMRQREARGSEKLYLANLSPGIYLIRVKQDDQERLMRLIVK
ncbi:MAG: PKD domain-containing protein, partial [Bacteroidota bacterium]